MSGSGRAGNGRGNNRKHHLFRRREKENDAWQENSSSESGASHNNDINRNDNAQRDSGGGQLAGRAFDRKNNNKGQQNSFPRHGNNRGKTPEESQNRQNRGLPRRSSENPRSEKPSFVERPKWVPPVINSDPLPVPECPWCGKPIRDISSAIADKDTGAPVHFDCVAARIAGTENLEKGESISYIGAGRFGIVSFGRAEGHDFKIRKIIEWENKDNRAEWRTDISEHYSVT